MQMKLKAISIGNFVITTKKALSTMKISIGGKETIILLKKITKDLKEKRENIKIPKQ